MRIKGSDKIMAGGGITVGFEESAASGPTGASAQTIVYIHGIGNKPPADILKCQWDHALFGVDLGERSRMAYWVNRAYYPTPLPDACGDGDTVAVSETGSTTGHIASLSMGDSGWLDTEVQSLTQKPDEAEFLRKLGKRVQAGKRVPGARVRLADVQTKVIPLPEFLRRPITRWLTSHLLRDVNDFLFHPDRREYMEQSLRDRLSVGGGPFVVVAHSQGTMIAYNVLRQLSKSDCDVSLFVTIGSPLGLDEVQDQLRQWTGTNELPVPPCVTEWVNVADRLDPVALDPSLHDDYTPDSFIKDHLCTNPDSPQHPHSGTGYLSTDIVRREIRQAVGSDFAQVLSKFVVARDLAGDLEKSHPAERQSVLIQLATDDNQQSLAATREQLVTQLREFGDATETEALERFVAARLTRKEVETLRSKYKELNIGAIWRDAAKKALIFESAVTIQSAPAQIAYNASGRGVGWAVLDTGICADHPHFQKHRNIVAAWDCTQAGPLPSAYPTGRVVAVDGNGHGTHVAGIIAGGTIELPYRATPQQDPKVKLAGIAPETQLHIYKVLDDLGNGRDSWIIKALDHIYRTNEGAGKPVICGVNLSLGGSFDVGTYGCGHSPLCQELQRLWRQGVLVCLAAGNEGYAILESADREIESNMDLSIGDPANLEEAIAVGSVHKTRPHTYGVSYFSSRGPTADGRRKPDLVAPGERILSALHRWQSPSTVSVEDQYVAMSGTSMATPHVSGILAGFLSVHREFIGYPDRVKNILLENCTDLNRDPYIQGHGLPNLVKMLANT
jgi:subtilisin family serine protease